jgi:hypothetical protein
MPTVVGIAEHSISGERRAAENVGPRLADRARLQVAAGNTDPLAVQLAAFELALDRRKEVLGRDGDRFHRRPLAVSRRVPARRQNEARLARERQDHGRMRTELFVGRHIPGRIRPRERMQTGAVRDQSFAVVRC